jgi:hypothetical protein
MVRSSFHHLSRLLGVLSLLGLGGSVFAQEFPNPLAADNTGFRPIGKPLRVEVTDQVNPLYLKIHLTAQETEGVEAIAIVDRTARRELFRFKRSDFAPRLKGVSPGTEVIFAKNFTFRRPEKRSDHVLMVTFFNANERPIRSSAFAFSIQPHPSELLAAEVSYQTFNDIAQIDFKDSCRDRLKRSSTNRDSDVILIGEPEQEFPSLGYLTKVQKQESLRGYFEGCTAAYLQCLGSRSGGQEQHVQQVCTQAREELRRDVFTKQ